MHLLKLAVVAFLILLASILANEKQYGHPLEVQTRPMLFYNALQKVSENEDALQEMVTTLLAMSRRLQNRYLKRQAEAIAIMVHDRRHVLVENPNVTNPKVMSALCELYIGIAYLGTEKRAIAINASTTQTTDARGFEDLDLLCSTSILELQALMDLAIANLRQDGTNNKSVSTTAQRILSLRTLDFNLSIDPTTSVRPKTIVEAFRFCETSRRLSKIGGAETKKKNAVVTLVAGKHWLRGALVLGSSLRRKQSEEGHFKAAEQMISFDMIAMCYEVTASEKKLLKLAGWTCISPPIVENPWTLSPWKWDYHLKVYPFNLTEYRRVLVLDSDMLVVDKASLLWESFERIPAFPSNFIYAVKDCVSKSLDRSSREELNGGLLLLTPDSNIFKMLYDLAPATSSIDLGGQGFFSTVFENRILWLSEQFNYLRHTRCILDFHLKFYPHVGFYDEEKPLDPLDAMDARWDELVKLHLGLKSQSFPHVSNRNKNVMVLHFHFKPKPWECNLNQLGDCGHVLGNGTSNVKALNRAWLDAEQELANFSESLHLRVGDSKNNMVHKMLHSSLQKMSSGTLREACHAAFRAGIILVGDELATEEASATAILDWQKSLGDKSLATQYQATSILLILKATHPEISEHELHALFIKTLYEIGWAEIVSWLGLLQ